MKDENPNNMRARMAYHAEFSVHTKAADGTVLSVSFNEKVVADYLYNCDKAFDLGSFMAVAKLVAMKSSAGREADSDLFLGLLTRAHVSCDKRGLFLFYDRIDDCICQPIIARWANDVNLQYKPNASSAVVARKILAGFVIEQLRATPDISTDDKLKLMGRIDSSGLIPESTPTPTPRKWLRIALITAAAVIAVVVGLILLFP